MGKPLDGARRRRIYLMRHAEAAYFSNTGQRTGDSRTVPLTDHGRHEAEAMRALLSDVRFDTAICSGLPRTRETAEIVTRGRDLPLEIVPDLEEIRPGDRMKALTEGTISPIDAVLDTAYSFWKLPEPGFRYAGGESLAEFRTRVERGFQSILSRHDWDELLLVCHGGVNRAIFMHILGGDDRLFPLFEQDSGCVNIIDVDIDPDTKATRRVLLRGMNITAEDPAKAGRRHTTLEGMALRVNGMLGSPLKLG